MILRIAPLAMAVLAFGLLLAACGNTSYPTNKADDQYNLEAMRLLPQDLPQGFEEAALPKHDFNNADWVQVTGAQDPEAKQNQLDAQGRVRSYVSVYQPQQLGRVFAINAISTLYKEPAQASDAATKYLCGTPTDETALTEPFPAPHLGDQTVGFLVPATPSADGSPPISETTVCVRTGRIIHAITLTGLEGTEDVSLAVQLAQRMVARIDDAFAGKPVPADETPPPPPAGTATDTPETGVTPNGASTPAPVASSSATASASSSASAPASPSATATR